ncbi:MAG TPA: FecR domain-containing protein [Polyangia bacterium]|nr:FecR domain-containing protein [Polyangia bacterium]
MTGLLAELPDAGVDDVTVRRVRQRVLDSAAVTAAPPAITRSLRTGAAIALGVLALGVGAALLFARRPGVPAPIVTASDVRVTSRDGAPILWSTRRTPDTEWIELRQGRFRVEVRGHDAGRRVVARVPDGRIDDLGTIFEVDVEGDRTTRVRVDEGDVQLWLSGADGVVLARGDTWERAPSPPPSAAPVPSPPPAAHPPGHHAAARGRDEAHDETHDEAQDAAYLQVIHLLRAGRRDEARAAALDYLARFPDGFRSAELRALTK